MDFVYTIYFHPVSQHRSHTPDCRKIVKQLKNFTSKICSLIAAWEIEEKLCIIRDYEISSVDLFLESFSGLNFVEIFFKSKTRFQAIR